MKSHLGRLRVGQASIRLFEGGSRYWPQQQRQSLRQLNCLQLEDDLIRKLFLVHPPDSRARFRCAR